MILINFYPKTYATLKMFKCSAKNDFYNILISSNVEGDVRKTSVSVSESSQDMKQFQISPS